MDYFGCPFRWRCHWLLNSSAPRTHSSTKHNREAVGFNSRGHRPRIAKWGKDRTLQGSNAHVPIRPFQGRMKFLVDASGGVATGYSIRPRWGRVSSSSNQRRSLGSALREQITRRLTPLLALCPLLRFLAAASRSMPFRRKQNGLTLDSSDPFFKLQAEPLDASSRSRAT